MQDLGVGESELTEARLFCWLSQTHIISRVQADSRGIKGLVGGAQLGVSRGKSLQEDLLEEEKKSRGVEGNPPLHSKRDICRRTVHFSSSLSCIFSKINEQKFIVT